MRKEVYTKKGAPPAGIYSQGIVADGPVAYIAGQGPIDPATKRGREGSLEVASSAACRASRAAASLISSTWPSSP